MSMLTTATVISLAPIAIALILLPLLSEDLSLATLYTSAGFALLAFVCTFLLIPILSPLFIQRHLKGRDRLKADESEMYALSPYM